jgi:hypothetical protein
MGELCCAIDNQSSAYKSTQRNKTSDLAADECEKIIWPFLLTGASVIFPRRVLHKFATELTLRGVNTGNRHFHSHQNGRFVARLWALASG